MPEITCAEIERAQERIGEYIKKTPILTPSTLSKKLGIDLLLKPEFLQETGSFKIRGAMNAMLSMSGKERDQGVTTASSGNHGPALACAARKLGAEATICLSKLVPENKIENVVKNGGKVQIIGKDYDESLEHCLDLVENKNIKLVHPFDDPHVVCGAGTVGLEILDENIDDIDCILVPVSGGGLLAGIATAVKSYKSKIRVIGVSMERGASMFESIKAKKPVNVKEEETIADALGGNIGLHNQWTFETIQKLADDIITVNENLIKSALRLIHSSEGLEVEGAGAVGVAAIMASKLPVKGKALCVLSGKNIARETFLKILNN